MNESLLVSPDVDYTQALPIQQKRIIAFINHFIMNTVSFLNTFSQTCESKLMDFDFKLQKVEASLLILESQLSSISDECFASNLNNNNATEVKADLPEAVSPQNIHEDDLSILREENCESVSNVEASKPSDNPLYSKYFKMLQVGVPLPAVKLKMQSEGFDPSILDNA